MRGKPWTADEELKAREMQQRGATIAEIALVLGRTTDSVRSRLGRATDSVPVGEVQAMQAAAYRCADPYLEMQVRPHYQPDDDTAEQWKQAEQQAVRAIERAQHRSKFTATFDAGSPIGIAFISDQHIAPGTPVDLKRMREDAELIARTPRLYACLAGDGVDNHIKIRAAMMASRSQPGDQYKLYNYYLGIFAPKIVAMISGNHDAWSDQLAGVDMVEWIAKQNKIAYCPAEARVQVQFRGGQEYLVAFRHQYRMNSSLNQTHAPKQWFRFGAAPFDVGVIGHHHEAAVETCVLHGAKRIVCRPGAYQISSAYTRQYGFEDAIPTCPTVIFYPQRRHMLAFDDVHDAALWLQHMPS